MNVNIFPLFSTPLYTTNLSLDTKFLLDYAKNTDYVFLEEVKNGYRSKNVYILEESEFCELKRHIEFSVNFFAHDILKVHKDIKFFLMNSWIMKHNFGHWAQKHFHNNSLLSGIFYLQVNENSGSIVFEKNQQHYNIFPPFFDIPFQENNEFNCTKYSIQIKNNDLILFPSHLDHYVNKNNSNEDRYCLAFNCFIRGTFGSDFNFNKLEFK